MIHHDFQTVKCRPSKPRTKEENNSNFKIMGINRAESNLNITYDSVFSLLDGLIMLEIQTVQITFNRLLLLLV